MKSTRICAALLTVALAVPAFGQVSVYIGTPPPPLRYECHGPPPEAGFVWIKEYGPPTGITIAGFPDTGSALHTLEPIGTIRITTIIGKAGSSMKATGTTKITTTIIGVITTTMTTMTITKR